MMRVATGAALLLMLGTGAAGAQTSSAPLATAFEVEGQAVWTSHIDVQSPNTAAGTRFALDGLTGSGPATQGRLEFSHAFLPRHELRLVYAPLSLAGSGVLAAPVAFEGRNFAAGVPTDGRYRFDSYRVGYRYAWVDTRDLQVKVGVTLKLREAAISLRQPGVFAERSDSGVVPLLHLRAEQRLGRGWRLIGDFDGLASTRGRAFDVAAKIGYDIAPDFTIAAGYRLLDGGADNDTIYSFSRFHYAVVSLTARF
jgi:hypothetical protein